MKEFERWLKQAEADFDIASYLLSGKKYYACANYCQQVVEKSLKALFILQKKELVKTHDVVKLGRLLSIPQNLLVKVSSIEPIFKESKYPDISENIPSEEYDLNDATEFFNTAEEVLIWCKNQMKL